jgi:hypothetical protein
MPYLEHTAYKRKKKKEKRRRREKRAAYLGVGQSAVHLGHGHSLDGGGQLLPVGRHGLAVSAPGSKEPTRKEKSERAHRSEVAYLT